MNAEFRQAVLTNAERLKSRQCAVLIAPYGLTARSALSPLCNCILHVTTPGCGEINHDFSAYHLCINDFVLWFWL
jgi:hypothetical protein